MVRQRVKTVGKRGNPGLTGTTCACYRAAPCRPSSAACHARPALGRLRPALTLALLAGLAPPVLAQNAASIPAVVTVIESPLASASVQGVYGWLPTGGEGQVPPLEHRVFLVADFVALATEAVEPARVRVRLEYVGN